MSKPPVHLPRAGYITNINSDSGGRKLNGMHPDKARRIALYHAQQLCDTANKVREQAAGEAYIYRGAGTITLSEG